MEQQNRVTPTLSTSTHLLVYFALYFLGAFGGFSISWVIAGVLTELGVLQPPWHVLMILVGSILGIYLPKNLFAKSTPAVCPSCGGAAYLKWPSKPIVYECKACGHVHQTHVRLGR